MSVKRFITGCLVEKVTYEKWSGHLTVSSYFLDIETLKQIWEFYPESII